MSVLKLVSKMKIDQQMFSQVVKSIGTLVEEATINVNVEGLTFRGMDPSHVAMLDIAIPNSAFEKYNVQDESKFAFRVDEFVKIIQSLNKTQIEIEITEDNNMIISQKGSRTKLKLIDTSATDTPLPRIPYDARIGIHVQDFKQALKQISVVSDYLTIDASESFVEFSGKGDNGESCKQYEKGCEEITDLDVKEHSVSTYSLEYLNPIVKTITKDSALSIDYSSVKPLRLSIRPDNVSRIDFYLAPRVED